VMFGSPETTTGGRALKFYASLRLDIRRIGAIKDGDRVVGNRTKVKVAKNKVAPPFRECEFDIMYGEGISREGDVLDLATAQRVVEKSGAWFSYKGDRLGQGRENAKQAMRENPELLRRNENSERCGRTTLPNSSGGNRNWCGDETIHSDQPRHDCDDGSAGLHPQRESAGSCRPHRRNR